MENDNSGIFIDLDGTLANSLMVMRNVYEEFLRGFDRSGSDDEFNRLNGPPLAVVVADLAQTHGLGENIESLLRQYWQLIEAAYETVEPNPGALNLLKVAAECNLKIGIVTSNMSYLAAAWVDRLNIQSNIDIIIGGDTVNLGKPHPEPYLSALQQTRCLASRSFAVEDSLTGIRAADAAGLKSFFLSDINDSQLKNTINVNNLDEVSNIIFSFHQNGF